MILPAYDELDSIQKSIFTKDNEDKNILIIGPPGTGKTIVAFHKALLLEKLGKNVVFIMYNKVLLKYTKSTNVATNINLTTMHSWIYKIWSSSNKLEGSKPPLKSIDNHYEIDWLKVYEDIKLIKNKDDLEKINWGHIIIDEGQDFPEEMFFCLNYLTYHFRKCGLECTLTVFADENQVIFKETNSRISSIEEHLGIVDGDNRKFCLTKNFRNTQQIAKFAKHFMNSDYYGREITFPKKEGPRPSILLYPRQIKNENKSLFRLENPIFFKTIKNQIEKFPNKKYAIIIDGKNIDLENTHGSLSKLFARTEYKVQGYINKHSKFEFSVENLDFISNNTITILNKKSSKGTEFDIVFFVGIEQTKYDHSEGVDVMKNLFVISSRAREQFYIIFGLVDEKQGLPEITKILPNPEDGISRFQFFGTSLKLNSKKILSDVGWG